MIPVNGATYRPGYTYRSMLTSWRNPPPRTHFALWWPGEKRMIRVPR
jgi:hypothetical protein